MPLRPKHAGTPPPAGCPQRCGQWLSQALGFGVAACAGGGWAQRPRG